MVHRPGKMQRGAAAFMEKLQCRTVLKRLDNYKENVMGNSFFLIPLTKIQLY